MKQLENIEFFYSLSSTVQTELYHSLRTLCLFSRCGINFFESDLTQLLWYLAEQLRDNYPDKVDFLYKEPKQHKNCYLLGFFDQGNNINLSDSLFLKRDMQSEYPAGFVPQQNFVYLDYNKADKKFIMPYITLSRDLLD